MKWIGMVLRFWSKFFKTGCCKECGKPLTDEKIFCNDECEHEYVVSSAW